MGQGEDDHQAGTCEEDEMDEEGLDGDHAAIFNENIELGFVIVVIW